MADRQLSEFAGDGLTWDGFELDVDYGTTPGTACEGDDSRLSDARAPTAHASGHNPGGGDALATAAASANPPGTSSAEGAASSLARSDHTHALAAFGSGSGTFCEGDDSRLSDSRTPTAHASSHNPGGGDALATAAASANPPGTSSAEGAASSLARSDHTHALAAFGSGSGTFCEGDDARLSDDRTADGIRTATTVVDGSGAAAPTSGQVPTATSSTTFTWQTPSGGGGPATQIDETGGPTTLAIGAIPDTYLTRRNGTTFEGIAATGAAVGLTSVTDDAQLKRAAGDIGTFTAKGTPTTSDVLLIEDAAAAGAKKSITIGSLPAAAPASHASSHLPSGGDPLATAAASANPPGTSSAEGTAESFARSDHTHALAAFGSGSGTFCEGNDSRLSDSRAPNGSASGDLGGSYPSPTVTLARGLKSATTTVSVAAAAAPTSGQVLKATSGTTATWQDEAGGASASNNSPSTIQPDDAADAGVGSDVSRDDHTHAIATAAASANPPGTSNAEGSSSSFARADHTHALAAFGSSSGTFCQGNDSRLLGPERVFWADEMDNTVNASWPVSVHAPVTADTNSAALLVRRFDNTTTKGAGIKFVVPSGATNIVLRFMSRAETSPGGSVSVVPEIFVREIYGGAAEEAFSAGVNLTALGFTNDENWQDDSQTIALSTLSMVAGRSAQLVITRDFADASDDMSGSDWTLLWASVAFT